MEPSDSGRFNLAYQFRNTSSPVLLTVGLASLLLFLIWVQTEIPNWVTESRVKKRAMGLGGPCYDFSGQAIVETNWHANGFIYQVASAPGFVYTNVTAVKGVTE